MTALQIVVFATLTLLLVLVGGLLLLSNRGTKSPRSEQRGRNDNGDLEHAPDTSSDSSPRSSREPEPQLPNIITEQAGTLERNGTADNHPPVTLRSRSKLYHYTALVTSVYDGDTLTVDIDLGLNMWAKSQVIRLWKVDTPELRGAERERGLLVRDEIRKLVLNKYVLVRTILDKRGQDKTGKYGRLLGEILVEEDDGTILNINDYLLAQNMAIPMGIDGSTVVKPASSPSRPEEVTPQRSAAPMPEGADQENYDEQAIGKIDLTRGEISCSFCGEIRAVDLVNQVVLDCPNCMDRSYHYGDAS